MKNYYEDITQINKNKDQKRLKCEIDSGLNITRF
jgi:hypothetical protein